MKIIHVSILSAFIAPAVGFAGACCWGNSSENSVASSKDQPGEELHVIGSNILETAKADENFSTLVAAIEAAGLEDAIEEAESLTVFAPTNEAFENLPDGTLELLLQEENSALLESILSFHVVPLEVTSDQIEDGAVPTLSGQQLQVMIDGETVRVGNAAVAVADIQATNGIIHAVNAVIIPPVIE